MKQKTYRVVGVQAFWDHPHGETFKADPEDPQIVGNLEAGVIREEQPESKKAADDSAEKEKE